MRLIKYISILGIVAVMLTSCEDWLDENPKYSTNEDVVFKNQNTAKQALDACYGYLTTTKGFGQCAYEALVNASGLSWGQTNGSEQDAFASMNSSTSLDVLRLSWNGYYECIKECNGFIANIAKSPLDDEIKANYSAQAYFLRGLCYYYLATTWGGVPLRTEPISHTTVKSPRATFEETIDQIMKDWDYAYTNLPDGVDAVPGYVNKTAVAAYFAKVNWLMSCNPDLEAKKGDYLKEAKKWCDAVYGKYSLESKFSNLFVSHVNGSKESIFQLNFSTTSALTWNRLNWVFSADGATKGVAYQRVRATKSFYDYFRGTYPGDPRLEATFLCKYYKIKSGSAAHAVYDSAYTYPYKDYMKTSKKRNDAVACIPYEKMKDPTNPTVAELQEYQNIYITANDTIVDLVKQFAKAVGDHAGWPLWKKQLDPLCSAQSSNNNIILYRYADFLLLMADVYNELGDAPKALSIVNNEILSRARNSSSPASKQPANWDAGLSKDQLRDKIFYERLFELGGEPDNYADIRRGGIRTLKMALGISARHDITKVHSEGIEQQEGNRFRDRYFGGGSKFNYGNINDDNFLKKNLHLPIPNEEISSNDGITSSDQNFGY